MKTYIKIYCIIASIILYIPPVYKQLPRGIITRASFPNNHCFLHDIIGSRFVQIDWSILSLELLLVAIILIYIYMDTQKS